MKTEVVPTLSWERDGLGRVIEATSKVGTLVFPVEGYGDIVVIGQIQLVKVIEGVLHDLDFEAELEEATE